MNIDKAILSSIKYLRPQFVYCTYTIKNKSTYNPTTDTYLETLTTKDLKCINQFEKIYHIEDSKVETNESLCLLYGKIDFVPKKDDTITIGSDTIIVQKIELNISKRAVIVHACRN